MFAGLKTAAGLALVGAVVGEFISAERGLGVLVQQFSSQLAIADAFAVILMLMFLGLLLYGVMEWLERATVFWLHDGRLVARSRRRAAQGREEAARGTGACPRGRGRRSRDDVEAAAGVWAQAKEEGDGSVQASRAWCCAVLAAGGHRASARAAATTMTTVAAEAATGGGTQEIVYNLPTPPSALFYPTLVAEELGFFEEEGVSPKLAPAAEEISATAFLDNGDADVSFADVDEIILARSKGGEHTAIFSPQHTNTAGIVVPEDSDIQDISGVEGQKVGLESEESTRFLAAMLDVGRDRPGRAWTPPWSARAARSSRRRSRTARSRPTSATRRTSRRCRRTTSPCATSRPRTSAAIDGNPLAVLPGTLEEKREAIVGFLRAWAKGQYVGQVNREVVEQIAREKVPGRVAQRGERRGRARPGDLAHGAGRSGADRRPARPTSGTPARTCSCAPASSRRATRSTSSEALDDELIEEINDWDRAEVEAAAEEYAGG